MIETDRWPMVPARWFTAVSVDRPRHPRLVVIHTMEYSESNRAAEDVAHYFATTNTKASAHLCIDNDSIVQCVLDRDVAYAAPGCNRDGIQLELAGYAAQSSGQWDDVYSRALLNNAANAAAQYCCKFDIPSRRLSNHELFAGSAGIIGHDQASQVYQGSDHQDPGPSFPWLQFITQIQAYESARRMRVA